MREFGVGPFVGNAGIDAPTLEKPVAGFAPLFIPLLVLFPKSPLPPVLPPKTRTPAIPPNPVLFIFEPERGAAVLPPNSETMSQASTKFRWITSKCTPVGEDPKASFASSTFGSRSNATCACACSQTVSVRPTIRTRIQRILRVFMSIRPFWSGAFGALGSTHMFPGLTPPFQIIICNYIMMNIGEVFNIGLYSALTIVLMAYAFK